MIWKMTPHIHLALMLGVILQKRTRAALFDTAISDAEWREFSQEILKITPSVFDKLELKHHFSLSLLDTFEKIQDVGIQNALPNTATVEPFMKLLDNYFPSTKRSEIEDGQEKTEQDVFMTSLMKTPAMKETYKFLHRNGKFIGSYREFGEYVQKIWFTPYTRSNTKESSSGFEHVFVGEYKSTVKHNGIRMGDNMGLHSWFRLYQLYKNQAFNRYQLTVLQKGKKRRFECLNKVYKAVFKLDYKYKWAEDGRTKTQWMHESYSSVLIGMAPEFDIALMTACFMGKPDDYCPIKLCSKKVGIKTYSWDTNVDDHYVATAYFA